MITQLKKGVYAGLLSRFSLGCGPLGLHFHSPIKYLYVWCPSLYVDAPCWSTIIWHTFLHM